MLSIFFVVMNMWRIVFLFLVSGCGLASGKLTTLVEERLVTSGAEGFVELHQLWETEGEAERLRRSFLIDADEAGRAELVEWGDYEAGAVVINLSDWLKWGDTLEFLLENGYEDYQAPERNRGQSATVFFSEGLDAYLEAVELFSSGQGNIESVDGVLMSSGSPYMLSRFWMYPSELGGWRETPIGLINDNAHPWLFSVAYGFLYEVPISPDNAEYAVWSWSPELGWIYIFPDGPEFFFKAETMRWAWRNPADGLIWDL